MEEVATRVWIEQVLDEENKLKKIRMRLDPRGLEFDTDGNVCVTWPLPSAIAVRNLLDEQLLPETGGVLPDGSAFATAKMPLPEDHWLYQKVEDVEPAFPTPGNRDTPSRLRVVEQVRAAAQQAIRGATLNGRDTDYDPDALVQNLIVALLGPWSLE